MALSFADIEAKLREFCSQRHKGWLANTDPGTVVRYVEQAFLREVPSHVAIIGNAFLMLTIGQPWWAAKPIAQEELFFSLDDKPIDLARVFSYAEQYARMHGAVGLAFGTSLSEKDRALSRLFQSHGFQEEARLHYKEIK